MRSSKKYQEIADILHKIVLKDREFKQKDLILTLDYIVEIFCFELANSNPRFKPEYFKNEVFK